MILGECGRLGAKKKKKGLATTKTRPSSVVTALDAGEKDWRQRSTKSSHNREPILNCCILS